VKLNNKHAFWVGNLTKFDLMTPSNDLSFTAGYMMK